ncbi:MAG: hypothetical protein GC192_09365 [Bacteroidetes bacterium]|nr:hypothetical protein [Bacteroidota bacterium]
MKIPITFILFAALLVSCHSVSQTSGSIQAVPKYSFKKAELPTISPCVQCVMSSAKKKYRRDNLSLPACFSGSTGKRYLKLSLTKGNLEQKLVVFRDCGHDIRIAGIVLCGSGACEFDSILNDEAQTFNCQGQPVLTLRLNSSSVGVTLASGWDLYYETVNCTGN